MTNKMTYAKALEIAMNAVKRIRKSMTNWTL